MAASAGDALYCAGLFVSISAEVFLLQQYDIEKLGQGPKSRTAETYIVRSNWFG